MSKIKFGIAVLLLIVMAASGCSPYGNDTTDRNIPDINPKAEAANKDTSNVTLYFSYRGENLFAGETRAIDVPVSDTLEAAVVRELIEGPSADRDELIGLFWQRVELVGVDTNADYIFITLSEDFVTTQADDAEIVLEQSDINEQKMLAIYSIVNTLTEMGKYSRVQILVDREGGVGQRITLSEAGWGDDEDSYLEPLGRMQSLILTPENTLVESLDYFAKNDRARLYNFSAHTRPDGTQKTVVNAFSDALAAEGNVLESFNVVDSNVSYSGQTVVVMLDYSIKTREGETVSRTNIPVVLVREEDIWKFTYTSLVNVLINV